MTKLQRRLTREYLRAWPANHLTAPNQVTGENNLEPNTNCYHNASYVAHSAPGRISIDRANEERSVIWWGLFRVGLQSDVIGAR